jgi:hypothetical protein
MLAPMLADPRRKLKLYRGRPGRAMNIMIHDVIAVERWSALQKH